MKTYEITVNNKVYQVSVEEIDEASAKKIKNEKIIQTSQPSQKESAVLKASNEISVKAPMPGIIINVTVRRNSKSWASFMYSRSNEDGK